MDAHKTAHAVWQARAKAAPKIERFDQRSIASPTFRYLMKPETMGSHAG